MPYMTVRQAADLYHVTPDTIRVWMRKGVIPKGEWRKMGGVILIRSEGEPQANTRQYTSDERHKLIRGGA